MNSLYELFRGSRSFPSSREVESDPGAMRRIGVIDVGSNSVRFVVFHGPVSAPIHFFNEKVLCGLGRDLRDTGRLHEDGRRRALGALRRFATLAERMNVSALDSIATAAVRDAEDGQAFCEEVLQATGLRLRVASGDDEARLAGQGVLLGWPDANGLVLDIGGASMELVRLHEGKVCETTSTPLGPLRLVASQGEEFERDAVIAQHLEQAMREVPGPYPAIYLVGGAWRGLAKLHMELNDYPLRVLHGFAPEPDAFAKTVEAAITMKVEKIAERALLSRARADTVPIAAQIMDHVLKLVDTNQIVVSALGLREGLLFDHLPPMEGARDPLLDAAHALERTSARFSGFGGDLFEWIDPLIADWSPSLKRLAHAACLLHDVNWMVHPDFRAAAGFDTVKHGSLLGIDHRARVFLGAALFHRYKNSGLGKAGGRLVHLLDDTSRKQAEMLGSALRLGAMISASAPGGLEDAGLDLSDEILRLTLRGEMVELAGEVVDKRLSRLARILDRRAQIFQEM